MEETWGVLGTEAEAGGQPENFPCLPSASDMHTHRQKKQRQTSKGAWPSQGAREGQILWETTVGRGPNPTLSAQGILGLR